MPESLVLVSVPVDVLQSIQDVVLYLWDAEENDFRARTHEYGTGPHVFEQLQVIRDWLDRIVD